MWPFDGIIWWMIKPILNLLLFGICLVVGIVVMMIGPGRFLKVLLGFGIIGFGLAVMLGYIEVFA